MKHHTNTFISSPLQHSQGKMVLLQVFQKLQLTIYDYIKEYMTCKDT